MRQNEVVDALLAIGAGDRDRALERLGNTSTDDPESVLADALRTHLTGDGGDGVYDSPEAFTAFIDGGGNVPLYERLVERLATVHSSAAPASVADIGCGDGRVTASVLSTSTTSVDLVEPSAELLDTAVSRLGREPVEVRGHEVGVADLLVKTRRRWDLVQSTFALHNLAPSERPPVLTGLAARTSRLLVAEFDVPAFDDRSRDHAHYAAERYERGLAEYHGSDLVALGFLMPVLVGQFDPAQPRHTFEQPIEAWVSELEDAGFESIQASPIHDYWWAPAVLIDARTTPR